MNIKHSVLQWIENGHVEVDEMCVLNINFTYLYNNKKLYDTFLSYIETHLNKSSRDFCSKQFVFGTICDDTLYATIYETLKTSNLEFNTIVLSYCTKERGMIRAYEYDLHDYKVYITQKTPSIFISNGRG